MSAPLLDGQLLDRAARSRDVTHAAGEQRDGWIAANVLDFIAQVSLLFGMLEVGEAAMTAGPGVAYLWRDSAGGAPLRLSSEQYVARFGAWCEALVRDGAVFSADAGEDFPPHFVAVATCVCTRIFRIYAHIYHHHFEQVVRLGAEPHLNTCFRHFADFVRAYQLVDSSERVALAGVLGVLDAC